VTSFPNAQGKSVVESERNGDGTPVMGLITPAAPDSGDAVLVRVTFVLVHALSVVSSSIPLQRD
jgi:hypothetical protein